VLVHEPPQRFELVGQSIPCVAAASRAASEIAQALHRKAGADQFPGTGRDKEADMQARGVQEKIMASAQNDT
jgi:hypothetical protein